MFKEINLHFRTLAEAQADQVLHSVAVIHEQFEDREVVFLRLQGLKEGPTLWLQAALHGDEYDGILACMHLLEKLDIERLSGSIVICPVANPGAFLAKANGNPADGVNMNRIFGQPSQDSYSYRYGRWLLDHILSQADYFIDLHGGGSYLEVCPFAMVASNHPGAFESAMQLLQGVELTAIYECSEQSKGMFINEVCRHGIPAVLLESGGGLSWTEESVTQHVKAVLALLGQASMLPRDSADKPSVTTPYRVREITELRFEVDGLQLGRVSAGVILDKGEALLELVSYPEFQRKIVANPLERALVLSIHTAASLKKGEYAVMLGKIENN